MIILKVLFLNYANTIIYYLKNLDEKDIFQSDYKDFQFTPSMIEGLTIDISSKY